MDKLLNEKAILQRMSREERSNVKGGGDTIATAGSLCTIKPTVSAVCDCLLAGCGCTPTHNACNECLASI